MNRQPSLHQRLLPQLARCFYATKQLHMHAAFCPPHNHPKRHQMTSPPPNVPAANTAHFLCNHYPRHPLSIGTLGGHHWELRELQKDKHKDEHRPSHGMDEYALFNVNVVRSPAHLALTALRQKLLAAQQRQPLKRGTRAKSNRKQHNWSPCAKTARGQKDA